MYGEPSKSSQIANSTEPDHPTNLGITVDNRHVDICVAAPPTRESSPRAVSAYTGGSHHSTMTMSFLHHPILSSERASLLAAARLHLPERLTPSTQWPTPHHPNADVFQ